MTFKELPNGSFFVLTNVGDADSVLLKKINEDTALSMFNKIELNFYMMANDPVLRVQLDKRVVARS